jgi:hypothetical protein
VFPRVKSVLYDRHETNRQKKVEKKKEEKNRTKKAMNKWRQ